MAVMQSPNIDMLDVVARLMLDRLVARMAAECMAAEFHHAPITTQQHNNMAKRKKQEPTQPEDTPEPLENAPETPEPSEPSEEIQPIENAPETPAVSAWQWPTATAMVSCDLPMTDHELAGAGMDLVKSLNVLQALEDEKKAVMASFKSRIEEAGSRVEELKNCLQIGQKTQSVPATWVFELRGNEGQAQADCIYEPNWKVLVRDHDGKVVRCAQITDDDRQATMNFLDETTPAAPAPWAGDGLAEALGEVPVTNLQIGQLGGVWTVTVDDMEGQTRSWSSSTEDGARESCWREMVLGESESADDDDADDDAANYAESESKPE